MFETRLTQAIKSLDFSKMLESSNVDRVVNEADGYQPHLVAPEMGYRRLLQECLILFKVRCHPSPVRSCCSGLPFCCAVTIMSRYLLKFAYHRGV